MHKLSHKHFTIAYNWHRFFPARIGLAKRIAISLSASPSHDLQDSPEVEVRYQKQVAVQNVNVIPLQESAFSLK